MGQGRLIGRGIGDGMLSVDYDDAGGDVTKLDQFGRLLGIVYDDGQTDPLHEFAFGYDRRGNREYVKALTRQLGVFDQYEQSWRYRYDGLNRLTSASRGDLDETGDDFEEGSEVETTLWALDDLGNWSGDANSNSYAVFADDDGDGVFDVGADNYVEIAHHDTNESNEIETVSTGDGDGREYPMSIGYDEAGNLVYDGRYYFEYDAWNRLCTISEPYIVSVSFGWEHDSEYYRAMGARHGAVLERFVYDALGRRVWTVDTGCMGEGEAACGEVLLPVKEGGTTTRHTYGSGAAVLAEYDVDSNSTETLQRWFIHGESFPDPLVLVDVTDAGDSPAGVEEYLYYIKDALGSIAALVNTNGEIVERYTYSPYGQTTITDAFGELLSGLWTQDVSYWYNHDFDEDLDPTDVAGLEYCIVYAPESWDCVFAHDYDTNGVVDIADYGYISYRWYVREDRTISVGGADLRHPEQVYFDSDRDGDLDLSDFAIFAECASLTETAGEGGVLVGTTGLIVNTTGFAACLQVFDADQDGTVTAADYAIVSAYLTNPNTPHAYPTGQWSSAYGNPFMWTGQRIDPRTGLYHFWARSYSPTLGRWLQEDKQGVLAATGKIMFSPAGFRPFVWLPRAVPREEYLDGLNLLVYVGAAPVMLVDPFGLSWNDDVDELSSDWVGQRLYALGSINEGAKYASVGLELSLEIAKSLVPGMGLYDAFNSVEVLAKGKGGFWDALNIATAALPFAHGAAKLIGMRSLYKARRFKFRACNCFVAGTAVDTPDGTLPIQDVRPGDIVLTRNQDEPNATVRDGRVTQVYNTIAPAIVWLTLASGDVVGTTPGHLVWSCERGWTFAGELQVGDSLVDNDGIPVEVVHISIDDVPSPVYNLEVCGTFTYFAEGVWVHNMSCPAKKRIHFGRGHGGTLHKEVGISRALELEEIYGETVRWNQTLVGPTGKKLSNLRPDIQYVENGLVYIEEIVVHNAPDPGRKLEFMRILGSKFGGYVTRVVKEP